MLLVEARLQAAVAAASVVTVGQTPRLTFEKKSISSLARTTPLMGRCGSQDDASERTTWCPRLWLQNGSSSAPCSHHCPSSFASFARAVRKFRCPWQGLFATKILHPPRPPPRPPLSPWKRCFHIIFSVFLGLYHAQISISICPFPPSHHA